MTTAETQTKTDVWLKTGNQYKNAENFSEAFVWYLKAASNGNPRAQFEVSLCFSAGTGCESDQLMALHWMNNAAKNGCGDALIHMGIYYSEGIKEATPIDFIESYKYFRVAHAIGHKNALGWLKLLHHWMSSQQIAEGKRRFRKFRSQHYPI